MSNVTDLTDLSEYKLRKLEESIVDGLSHPDPEVLKIWTEMARDTIRKFPGAPEPSKSSITLTMPSGASEQERATLEREFIEAFSSYKQDVMAQLLELLKEHMILQKEVAERRAKET